MTTHRSVPGTQAAIAEVPHNMQPATVGRAATYRRDVALSSDAFVRHVGGRAHAFVGAAPRLSWGVCQTRFVARSPTVVGMLARFGWRTWLFGLEELGVGALQLAEDEVEVLE